MHTGTGETSAAIVGLTAQEAEARLGQFGPNEPAATQQRSFLSDLLHEFTNPLVLIPIIAAIATPSADRSGGEVAQLRGRFQNVVPGSDGR